MRKMTIFEKIYEKQGEVTVEKGFLWWIFGYKIRIKGDEDFAERMALRFKVK
jgi:hypothetical protein